MEYGNSSASQTGVLGEEGWDRKVRQLHTVQHHPEALLSLRPSLELPCPWGYWKGSCLLFLPQEDLRSLHSFRTIEFLCWAIYRGKSNPILVLVNLPKSLVEQKRHVLDLRILVLGKGGTQQKNRWGSDLSVTMEKMQVAEANSSRTTSQGFLDQTRRKK